MSGFRYRAFISYSHADQVLAAWLHRALESYRIPEHVVAQHGLSSNRLIPIFRDREELATSESLSATITEALRVSEHLIVMCSPAAAGSRWVNQEIRRFKELRADGRVLCLLVGDPAQSIPPAARKDDGTEPLAADVRPHADGREGAKLKIIAGLLGIGLDELQQREAQRRQRRLLWIAAASTAGMAFAIGLSVFAFISRQNALSAEQQALTEAQTAERTLAFLTDLLRDSDPQNARGAEISVREVLDRAAVRIGDELADEPLVQAALQQSIGEVYAGLGLYDRAQDLIGSSVATYSSELGEADLQTLDAQVSLANAWWRLGRYDDAQPILENVLEERRTRLGVDHEETLDSQNHLASLFVQRNELTKAEALYRNAWEIRSRSHGSEDALTAGLEHNLANVLERLGRKAEALSHFESVYVRRRALQGSDHPHTLGAAMAVSSALASAGRIEEAEALGDATYEAMRRVLGEDHPDTLAMLGNQAGLELHRGRNAAAGELYRRQIAGFVNAFGPDHQRALVARRNLSLALQLDGRLNDAEAELATAAAGLSRALGADNLMTLDTRGALATIWAVQGRNLEAKREFEAVLPGMEGAVGPKHPDVLELLYNLACVATRLGEKAQAVDYLRRAIEGGFLHPGFLTDPDLAPLHGIAEFEALATRVREASTGTGT